jgi:hypothetical protein
MGSGFVSSIRFQKELPFIFNGNAKNIALFCLLSGLFQVVIWAG